MTRRVVLYGKSLVMSTIGTILHEKPEFHVQQVEELLPDIVDRLATPPPDVILFDLASVDPHFAIPLMRKVPTLMVIGVDLSGNKMLVLSGEQSRLVTADDLVRVIQGGASPTSFPGNG